MIEERELLANNIYEEIAPTAIMDIQEHAGTSRISLPSTSRRRASTADLLKAHLALMEREVILSAFIVPRTRQQNDLFRLVKYHYYALQSWHDQHTGWRIQRSASAIRLVRHPSAATPGYLYDRLKDPGDFACLVWILWFAENRQLTGRGNDQQFLLSQLAEQIQEQSTSGATSGRAFDFRRPTDRYNMQRALQYLEDLGGLQLVDGQTREWVEQTATADVLYEFTDVTRSLVAGLNPQFVATVAEHLHDTSTVLQPTLLPGDNTSPLVRAWRALLLGPALFRFDDPAAFVELLAHADAIADELIETFGWLLDIQRDYASVVRASGMSGGPVTSLTPYGTNDQMAMLLCTAIREQVEAGTWPTPDAYGCLHVTTEDLSELFYAVRERYSENWGSEARNKGSRSLLNDVYRKMRQIGLMRGPDEHGNALILPTAARYTATYDKAEPEMKTTTKNASRAKPTSKQDSKSSKETVAVKLPGLDQD